MQRAPKMQPTRRLTGHRIPASYKSRLARSANRHVSEDRTLPPFIVAFLLGLVAGIEAFVALAAVSWAAYFGHFPVAGTHFAFMAHIATPIILTLLAIAEIIYVRTPRSAGNKDFAPKLVLRIFLGAFVGAVIGSSHQSNALFDSAACGAIGAIASTFGSTVLFELFQKCLNNERRASIALNTLAVLAGLLVLIPLR
jgi:uncharacterized membrane protein